MGREGRNTAMYEMSCGNTSTINTSLNYTWQPFIEHDITLCKHHSHSSGLGKVILYLWMTVIDLCAMLDAKEPLSRAQH